MLIKMFIIVHVGGKVVRITLNCGVFVWLSLPLCPPLSLWLFFLYVCVRFFYLYGFFPDALVHRRPGARKGRICFHNVQMQRVFDVRKKTWMGCSRRMWKLQPRYRKSELINWAEGGWGWLVELSGSIGCFDFFLKRRGTWIMAVAVLMTYVLRMVWVGMEN